MGETALASGQDTRTYETAVAILQSRRRKQRPDANPIDLGPLADRIPDGKGKLDVRGTPSIAGMKDWLRQIGHSDDAINSLNIIHVAGTKGKGSTCAFAESLLHAFGQRTGFPRKTGLYTSPHLVYTEERIRIDAVPIPRELFAKYFFEIWEPLSRGPKLPRYLQLLFLLATHAFIREGVDAAIIETHHGGEYDATNVIERPVVTVVTPLGMDHAKQLGPTIRNIAWHKAGIFKPGAMAFASAQDFEETVPVLEERAAENEVLLRFVAGDDPDLPRDSPDLMPDVQRANCSLALAAVRALLKVKCPQRLGSMQLEDIEKGVENFQWPGRFQHVAWGSNAHWFLDGAHNEMSVGKAADWFVDLSSLLGKTSLPQRVVIFNQHSDERDPARVMDRLTQALKDAQIDHVIFANYNPHKAYVAILEGDELEARVSQDQAQIRQFTAIWNQSQPQSVIHVSPDIQHAILTALQVGNAYGGMHALITGSLHLVGGALHFLSGLGPEEA